MQEELQDNFKQVQIWKRIGFIVICAVIAGVVRTLIYVLVLLQIVATVITGNVNRHILGFGRQLAGYFYHLMLFMTFNTDEVPFPFSAWSLTESVISNRDIAVK